MFKSTLSLVLLLGGISIACGQDKPNRQALMPQKHAQLFKTHCFDCHDSDSEEAGVNLEKLSYKVSQDNETAELWQKILNAINSGEMPPADADPLPDALKADFLEDLTANMVMARKILGDAGGVITLRRLNRREYANTIESLLGVTPDVSSLPTDQDGKGFDTQGASLYFSSDQLEQYLASARQALKLCLLAKPARGNKANKKLQHRIEPEEIYTPHYTEALEQLFDKERRFDAWKAQTKRPASEFGFQDEYAAKKQVQQKKHWAPQLEWYLSLPETKTGATLIMTIKSGGYTRITFPKIQANSPGKYTIRVRAAHYAGAPARFHFLEFSSGTGKEREYLGWRRVHGTLEQPELVTFDVDHRPGEDLVLHIHQRSHQDRGDKSLWTRAMLENGMGTPPGVWIDWAELVGPEVVDSRPSDLAKEILFDRPNGWSEKKYVAEVIRRFGAKSFRGRTPNESFVQRLLQHFESERESGLGLKEAMISPLAIMLASPEFLYFVESATKKATPELSQEEIAVRLSYFLWSSPPDDQLMSMAKGGKLGDPQVLSEQTERLLRDPRAKRFVRDFSHQWLEMERLGMFQFNGLRYPLFDNAVRESAREEIFETVLYSLNEQKPLGHLLNADYVIVNDVLADYYELPDVKGHEFRLVQLSESSLRGGLISTAAVLAMGSDGIRTSPVERGAWVLRHLLHDPPAPAPPNVPQLSRIEETVSARDLQRAHQEQPQCAQCHRKIDPIGYGMECFGADGRWRDTEEIPIGSIRESSRSKFMAFEIDSTGQLPNGEKFEDFPTLREAIAKHEDSFARGFAEHLIAYGLGRPFGFSDQELCDSILESAKKKDYTINAFIHAFVQSKTFQSR